MKLYSPLRSKQNQISALIGFLGHSAIAGLVIGSLLSVSVSPIYAWWFDSPPVKSSITPTHQSGLVLSPLIQNVVPQFILEPLVQTNTEEPPSVAHEEPEPTLPELTPVNQIADSSAHQQPQAKVTASYSATAEQMLVAVNRERQQRGLPVLALNKQLTKSAQDYAIKMQSLNFFSHTDPQGTTFRQRNEAAGYTNWRWMGENIAYGQTSVDEVINDWMNSEGHRKNILSPEARELGVGYVGGAKPYWVQEFGVQF